MRWFSITLAFSLFAGMASTDNVSRGLQRALVVDGTEASYSLSRGATSFVIGLKDGPEARKFVFVNENAAAEGELSIAVAQESLAADSPRWSVVEGRIRFRKKRVFTVSLVGVEAKYVRLTFEVRAEGPTGGKSAANRARPYRLARIASS